MDMVRSQRYGASLRKQVKKVRLTPCSPSFPRIEDVRLDGNHPTRKVHLHLLRQGLPLQHFGYCGRRDVNEHARTRTP